MLGQPSTCPQTGLRNEPKRSEKRAEIGTANWTPYQTKHFKACAAASPSVWFPNWTTYASTCHFQADTIYLSLGNKESKAKNQLLAHVGEDMESLMRLLKNKKTTFEWNEGNHFAETDLRTAKAFAWCINQLEANSPKTT